MVTLVGPNDEFLKRLEDALDADILVRGNEIHLAGHPADLVDAGDILSEMMTIIRTGQSLSVDDVDRVVAMTRNGEGPAEVMTADVLKNRGKIVRPKTLNQKRYVDAIDANTVTFGLGPAGTGKTYLAMAKAMQALQTKQVSRIILTRPAVEAGEKIGYLPGTLSEKIDPYLRPLYDALHDMVDSDTVPRLLSAGTVEVAPLAYMRGRTLNDAFVILDEAQNTSPQQMKMFLTRLGFGSKIVVTGDVTQVDLPPGVKSGLRVVQGILDGIDDIHFSHLTSSDVVRHRLVAVIVDADAPEGLEAAARAAAPPPTPAPAAPLGAAMPAGIGGVFLPPPEKLKYAPTIVASGPSQVPATTSGGAPGASAPGTGPGVPPPVAPGVATADRGSVVRTVGADAAELGSSDPPPSVATESTEQTTWAELATSDRPAAHYVSAPDGHGMPDVDPRYLSETLMLGNPGERR